MGDAGHGKVTGIREVLEARRGRGGEWGTVGRQEAEATEEFAVNRLQLLHHPVRPMGAEGGFAAHQFEV